jgi:hypothetical protein
VATLIRPHELHIEANASCQLRCPTCPTTSQGYPPVVGSGYLHFTELLQIIEYGFRKGIAISADSGVNLNFVREGVLEGLVKYRFRSLLCSIDGATPETYRMYRVGGNFERVIKHTFKKSIIIRSYINLNIQNYRGNSLFSVITNMRFP